MVTTRGWTYGVEHELADWDTTKGWLSEEGFGRDPEPNICNSNGIATDPRLISYKFGGEFTTPSSFFPEEQADHLARILSKHRNAKANWRCGLHVHIRIPGLITNLPKLKRIAKYISENTEVYELVDPLPRENPKQHTTDEELACARKRYNWMRMSHFTKIPMYRVEQQLKAKTVDDFFSLEVPRSKAGKVLWHAQPRAAINLRQLLQTNTIEFRHFPATTDPEEVITAVEWCRDYLCCVFDRYPAIELFNCEYSDRKFPTLKTIYNHKQDVRWRNTTITKNRRTVIEQNIKRYLEEDQANVSRRRKRRV